MNSGSFKDITNKLFVYKSYILNIYVKQDLALNYLQGLVAIKHNQETIRYHLEDLPSETTDRDW